MRIKIALTGLLSWAILATPAVAELCSSALPEYRLTSSDIQTGSAISVIELFSETEIEQGERFREAITQVGYDSARDLIGPVVSPGVAAHVLVRFGPDLELPDSALTDALTLLEVAPDSERRDVTLHDIVWAA
ncbi:MAG: hypothetical protein AAFU53_08715, partial [Cyanobacteria bacterium J06632_3]